jgi:hypothetical protein
MLFVACLILPHWFMVADEPAFVAARQVMDGFLEQHVGPFVTANVATWATGILLAWFWAHIRPVAFIIGRPIHGRQRSIKRLLLMSS